MKVTKIPALKGIANKVRLDIIQEIYYDIQEDHYQ